MEKKLDVMSSIDRVMAMGVSMLFTLETNQNQWKDDIRQKWVESRKLPRKKKKQERKSLLFEWGVASWSPFDDNESWRR